MDVFDEWIIPITAGTTGVGAFRAQSSDVEGVFLEFRRPFESLTIGGRGRGVVLTGTDEHGFMLISEVQGGLRTGRKHI